MAQRKSHSHMLINKLITIMTIKLEAKAGKGLAEGKILKTDKEEVSLDREVEGKVR